MSNEKKTKEPQNSLLKSNPRERRLTNGHFPIKKHEKKNHKTT